jgi:hypothetical protein
MSITKSDMACSMCFLRYKGCELHISPVLFIAALQILMKPSGAPCTTNLMPYILMISARPDHSALNVFLIIDLLFFLKKKLVRLQM